MEIALNIKGRARVILAWTNCKADDLPKMVRYIARSASRIYSAIREESGEGASTFQEGTICAGYRVLARISYNGRVWPPGEHVPDAKPIYDPRTEPR